MQRNGTRALRSYLCDQTHSADRFFWDETHRVRLSDLATGTCLDRPVEELSGRSVLVATRDQLATALALIELDGVAARVVICPPDVLPEPDSGLVRIAGVQAVVVDSRSRQQEIPGIDQVRCSAELLRTGGLGPDLGRAISGTEWVLLTSGTSAGAPKMIVHNLATLSAPIGTGPRNDNHPVWGTFYDIRRYGGLQIFLRAVLGTGSLILSGRDEPVSAHLGRLERNAVTHLSGTPSHWRRALLTGEAGRISPQYVRLSGEIADQAILDALRSTYSQSVVAHAFASTEAGVAFEVTDGLEGFPSWFMGLQGSVEMKLVEGSLRIRSDRHAIRYLDRPNQALADHDGFVDTGDMLEHRQDRYYFLGRRDGVINVGGLKVYPEEVEAVISRHPAVHTSLVRGRKNPITGFVVSAEVVIRDATVNGALDREKLEAEILALCRQNLPSHKVPATIRRVAELDVAAAGKLRRV